MTKKKTLPKKPYFWPISPILGAKKVFLINWTVIQNFIRVSGTMPKIQGNLIILFQENT